LGVRDVEEVVFLVGIKSAIYSFSASASTSLFLFSGKERLWKGRREGEHTVLPALTAPAAFLAFQERLATPLAITLQGLFARFVACAWAGLGDLRVERDGERGAWPLGGGDGEGLQG
jgi:hypothetical protein